MVQIEEFLEKFPDRELVKRALHLYSLWGECVYFQYPPELSSVVILDPKFLTKDILGQLFNPETSRFKDGKMVEEDMKLVWTSLKAKNNADKLIGELLTLMELFEICFLIKNPTSGKRILLMPSLLPETLPLDFKDWWTIIQSENKVNAEKILAFNLIPQEFVSRLFVRLHKKEKLEEKYIWRSGMVLVQDASSYIWVQVNKNAEVSINPQATEIIPRIHISIFSKQKKDLIDLMELLTTEIQICSESYSGVKFVQYGRSPLNHSVLIPLSECFKAMEQPKAKRTVKDPKNRELIDAAKILADTGIYVSEDTETGRLQRWSFTPNANWVRLKGGSQALILPVIEGGVIKNAEYHLILQRLIGPAPTIIHAFAVFNEMLLNRFKIQYQILIGKMKTEERSEGGQDWRRLPNSSLREAYYEHYLQYAKKYKEPNDPLPIVPMIQGTNEGAIVSICENGFAIISAKDAGFYGSGIYMTSHLSLARRFTEPNISSSGNFKGRPYIVAAVIPGNVFPCTDHPFIDENGVKFSEEQGGNPNGYYGRGVRGGYESHYTLVKDSAVFDYPIEGPFDPATDADELVIFQDAYALPLFIIYENN